MFRNNINKNKLKKKIHNDFDPYEDFSVIFGLYYKDIEDEGEFLLSISYDVNILYRFRNKYLDENEIKNSWIGAVDLFLVSKISLFKEMNLILKCNNDIMNKFIINKIDFIEKKKLS